MPADGEELETKLPLLKTTLPLLLDVPINGSALFAAVVPAIPAWFGLLPTKKIPGRPAAMEPGVVSGYFTLLFAQSSYIGPNGSKYVRANCAKTNHGP